MLYCFSAILPLAFTPLFFLFLLTEATAVVIPVTGTDSVANVHSRIDSRYSSAIKVTSTTNSALSTERSGSKIFPFIRLKIGVC